MSKPVYVFIGMTGAGKSTIASLVCERMGFRRIKNTTTRPQRNAEDTEYNFVTVEDFLNDQDRYIAIRKYHAILEDVYKDYYYAVDRYQLEDGGVMITDFDGLKELFERGFNVVGIYLYADYQTRLQRAENRPGFKLEEFERRNADDLIRFDIERLIETGRNNPLYLVDNSHDRDVEQLYSSIHGIIVHHME